MTNKPKRTLSPRDIENIAEIWRRIQSLQALQKSALPPTAKGAWIYEAADFQLQMLFEELETLYRETETPEVDERR